MKLERPPYQHLNEGETPDQLVETAGVGNVSSCDQSLPLESAASRSRVWVPAIVSCTLVMLIVISVSAVAKRSLTSIERNSQQISQLSGDDAPEWAEQAFQQAVSRMMDNGNILYSSQDFESCRRSSSEKCSLSSMDKLTLVYPGAPTTCLQGEYGFFVYPGDPRKLLVFFQGGGACWDATTYHAGACQKSLEQSIKANNLGAGVFNRSDELNPYREYTIVRVNYCSGDCHTGNTTRKWGAKPVSQMGYNNANAAVIWMQENVAKNLSSLVLSGASAGALGTQAWAGYLLQGTLGYTMANVIADSFAGVFPAGTQSVIIKDFGACDLPIYTSKIQTSCEAGTVTIQDIFSESFRRFPGVPFGNIQSKADVTQISFYIALAFSFKKYQDMTLTGPQFFYKSNAIFQRYSQSPNYVEYYVDGSMHCYTPYPRYYTAGTKGYKAGSGGKAPTLLYQWMKQFSTVKNGYGSNPISQCFGPRKENNKENGDRYCDKALYPKGMIVTDTESS